MNLSSSDVSAWTRFAGFPASHPFHRSEHASRSGWRLRFIGSSLPIGVALVAFLQLELRWLLLAPVVGHGFAWIGHFVFGKNRPTTVRYPMYSLMGDWVMYRDMLRGKIRF